MTGVIVLTLCAGLLWALLCWLGWRRAGRFDDSRLRRGLNAARYEQALAELDTRLAHAELTPQEAAAERRALQAQLLASAEAEPQSPWRAGLGAPSLALWVALPLALTGAAFVATDGGQHWPQAPEQAAAPDVEAMVAGLAERLQRDPDDLRGWVMLGRSYMVMQRYEEAAAAWEEANARSPQPDPDLLVAEAEALGLARGQDLEGRPERLIRQALARNPDHIKGLWYAGLAARQRGDAAATRAAFERLQAQPDLPEPLQQALAELGFTGAPPAAGQAGQASQAADAAPALQVQVQLDPALDTPPPGRALFVYARAPQGPPMPLAVQRISNPRFPLTVQLDDSMAMLEGRTLSAAQDIELVARLSASGQAMPGSGDWQGLLRLRDFDLSAAPAATVIIDTVVP